MAKGNQSRRGAIRAAGSKKGMIKGTGGHGRKRLEGRGPTPKAEDRTWHPAGKRRATAERREAAKPKKKMPGHLTLPADHEVIAGRNPVYEAVAAGIPLLRIFLAPGTKNDDRLGKVLRTATAMGAPMLEVSKSELDALSDGAVHQGIAIEVPPYQYADFSELLEQALAAQEVPLFVALDQVTDPHNLGAVLRSAGAFGAHGVLLPERRSAGVNATTWKVSAGAAARVPVAQVTNLVRALQDAKAAGCFVVGLAGGTEVTTADFELATSPLVLVTGSEGTGLSRLVTDTCDQVVSIPISPVVESLNAAVATGIALYDVRRRRELPGS